jgi:hypothetical protein
MRCRVPTPHCILGVTVESVIAAVRDFIGDVTASTSVKGSP